MTKRVLPFLAMLFVLYFIYQGGGDSTEVAGGFGSFLIKMLGGISEFLAGLFGGAAGGD